MLKALKSLPISVKLMATTTLLLLFTVGLYGVMNLRDLSAAFDEARLEQQQMLERSVAVDARNVTGAIARTSGLLIAATAYGDITALLEKMREGDERLLFVQIHEGDKVVAEVGDAPAALAGLVAMPDKSREAQPPGEAIVLGSPEGDPRVLRITLPFGDEGLSGRADAGWSITDIAERTGRIERRIDERKRLATINALFVGGMIVLLGVVLTILQSLRISRPIRELTESVERIAHGDLSERALVDSTDEIGVLGRNFNYMAERIGVLLRETKERATYEKEMEVARVIQESLLPPSQIIDRGFIEFIGYCKSASICGGDWWNYAEISGGRLLILIGDVTGHGVSSAMITAAAKSCCDTLRHVTEGELTVTFLLEELNKTIYEAANRRFVMTFFATIIDPAARTITFSNAGHNFPLLFRANPAEGEAALVPLVTRGNRLGDVMESRFLERTVPYAAGDVLVWYTDGLTEGMGKNGEEYSEKRFRRSISAVIDKGADVILDRVIRDAEAFFADFANPEDDITLVVGKFRDRPAARDEQSPKPPPPPLAG